MKRLHHFLGLCLSAALFAACSTPYGNTSPAVGPKKIWIPPYTVVYNFTGGPNDGANPNYGSLINVKGILYGNTYAGGSSGYGTLYQYQWGSGSYKVLVNFGSGNTAMHPWSGVTYWNGNLIGTTFDGGTSSYCSFSSLPGCGTIFKVAPDGTGLRIYSFLGGRGGQFPQASLVPCFIYSVCGSTNTGGAYGHGLIFSVAQYYTGNVEIGIEYDFHGGASIRKPDGSNPEAPLTPTSYWKGLYGTTYSGGTHSHGTIFQLIGNSESVVYSFKGAPDAGGGEGAGAALVQLNGLYYGTTVAGGDATCSPSGSAGGCGTVFSFDPYSNVERVVFAFKGANGEKPLAGLLVYNGALYGTTQLGGAYGAGTVYKIDPASGTETVMHSFGSGNDGAYPQAGLVHVNTTIGNGWLFGTTRWGGKGGYGTIFRISP